MDVDRIPLEGETVVGRNYHTTHGGKGSNMAACATRLGAATAFLGKIGRDSFGEDFLRLLDREGVNRHAVLFSDTLPTAVGFIVFSARGTNLIVIDRGANGDFLPPDVEMHAEEIRGADVAMSPLEIPLEDCSGGCPRGESGRSEVHPQSCSGRGPPRKRPDRRFRAHA